MTQPTFEHLECRLEHGILVVTLLDTHVSGDEMAEALRREMVAAADAFKACKWIIDFGRVRLFTSSGIRPLLTLHRKLQGGGARLMLCAMREDIAEVFHATRLLATPGAPPGPFESAKDLEHAFRRIRRHTSRVDKDVLILTLTERDLRGEELAVDLGRELLQSWREAQTPKVVIDFRDVAIVTTPGIRCLLQLRSQIKDHGVQIALCNLSPQVAEVFTVTHLISSHGETASLFAAYADVRAALEALQAT